MNKYSSESCFYDRLMLRKYVVKITSSEQAVVFLPPHMQAFRPYVNNQNSTLPKPVGIVITHHCLSLDIRALFQNRLPPARRIFTTPWNVIQRSRFIYRSILITNNVVITNAEKVTINQFPNPIRAPYKSRKLRP